MTDIHSKCIAIEHAAKDSSPLRQPWPSGAMVKQGVGAAIADQVLQCITDRDPWPVPESERV